MTRTLLAGTALLGLLAFTHTAHASHAQHDCRLTAAADPTGEPGWYTGNVTGYVVSTTPAQVVSIRCYVGPADLGSASGPQAAVVSGQVTFVHSGGGFAICHDWTAGGEFGTSCRPATLV